MTRGNAPRKISHIGIAVQNLEASIKWYQDVLGLPFEGIETVESEHVRVAFFTIGESRIELLEPTSEESAIAKFLARHGEGIHHIAFEVNGLTERLQQLSEKGVRLIHDKPKRGAHQMNIAFLHPKSTGGVLMELCEPVKSEEKE
ncbi:methylmalonyl-CoA epimerase [Lihuaxuella thermophila]|uniref:Methylmalonyl-CoA mutase, C-terminal domain/methylmalonyl-CoA/ethylmalonyl-CoA epimerase n=1 Tax=Lihuaxuella thermophila TaxID=1173111 RepID=A0A1H8EPQ4_9BACL|nr:methylmalonyl-CoA epimerase [Lihuaxuella thermophila]SEN21376.1 methylmalonyl-CoA mutase, C-terminal domain/methylmalonyl-CoA/ethylmalonyl-CoA epimerase [Lihuaxuella thermophila]